VTKRNAVAATQASVFALDPTCEQASALRSHIGGSRFAYNALLGLVIENWDENRAKKDAGIEVTGADYLGTSRFDLARLWNLKRDVLAPWWRENGASAYGDAVQISSMAIKNFQHGKAQFPRFERKRQGDSVRFTNHAVKLRDSHHVQLARVGRIKTYESTRKLYRHLCRGTGRILAATVSERSGKSSIAFCIEVTGKLSALRTSEKVIGVDVGIKILYTGATSEGEQVLSVADPRHLQRAEEKLKRAQRIASRRQGPKPGQPPSERWVRAHQKGVGHPRQHPQRKKKFDS
jgi:putative transposase